MTLKSAEVNSSSIITGGIYAVWAAADYII